MKKAKGIRLVLKPWSKERPTTFKESLFAFPWGVILDINVGQIVRPIMKPWKVFNKNTNPWKNVEDRWFVFRSVIPIPLPFISVVLPNEMGVYIGAKMYTVGGKENPRYDWAKDNERDNVYTCPSATLRKTARD